MSYILYVDVTSAAIYHLDGEFGIPWCNQREDDNQELSYLISSRCLRTGPATRSDRPLVIRPRWPRCRVLVLAGTRWLHMTLCTLAARWPWLHVPAGTRPCHLSRYVHRAVAGEPCRSPSAIRSAAWPLTFVGHGRSQGWHKLPDLWRGSGPSRNYQHPYTAGRGENGTKLTASIW